MDGQVRLYRVLISINQEEFDFTICAVVCYSCHFHFRNPGGKDLKRRDDREAGDGDTLNCSEPTSLISSRNNNC
jgi:hypothetical protein